MDVSFQAMPAPHSVLRSDAPTGETGLRGQVPESRELTRIGDGRATGSRAGWLRRRWEVGLFGPSRVSG